MLCNLNSLKHIYLIEIYLFSSNLEEEYIYLLVNQVIYGQLLSCKLGMNLKKYKCSNQKDMDHRMMRKDSRNNEGNMLNML